MRMRLLGPGIMVMLLSFLAACTPKGLPLRTIETTEMELSTDEFLRTAMYNGMAQDRFPPSLAEGILASPNVFFVGKCPICTPVKAGIREYVNAEPGSSKVRVPAEILNGLNAEETDLRQAAMRELVQRYTQAEMKRLNLSEAAQERLEGELAADRKRGMALKQDSFGKFCPSCDGACKVSE